MYFVLAKRYIKPFLTRNTFQNVYMKNSTVTTVDITLVHAHDVNIFGIFVLKYPVKLPTAIVV